jgi:subtilisin family serine protease
MDTGVIDVVAAGNSGSEGGSPSTTPGAFSAGAVSIDGEVTRFSSYDPNQDNPDVMGVGKNVKMARANGTSMGKVLSDDFVKSSGTSFSSPCVGAAIVEALRAGKSQVVRSFERAAKNLPGRRDGAGVMKLAPAIEDPGQDSTEATAWNFNGSDMLFLEDVNWLPSVDDVRAEKVEETADHITIRLQK